MVKRLFFAILLIAMSVFSYAQDVKEVTLVVNGEGSTKEEATHVALRSAIEQAFGTFVSANTTILNDELVKDEIATISSGNIQKYTELGSYKLPNGNTSVSIEATVSIGKLVSYAKSKGSECEFAGATFGANLKMAQLKYQTGIIACNNLIEYIKQAGPDAFEYTLELGEPRIDGSSTSFDGNIIIDTNNNTRNFCVTVARTLLSLQMTDKEDEMISTMDRRQFDEKYDYSLSPILTANYKSFYLPQGKEKLKDVLTNYCLRPITKTNLGTLDEIHPGGQFKLNIVTFYSYPKDLTVLLSIIFDYYRNTVLSLDEIEVFDKKFSELYFKWLYYPEEYKGFLNIDYMRHDFYEREVKEKFNNWYCLETHKKSIKKIAGSTKLIFVRYYYEVPLPPMSIGIVIDSKDLAKISKFIVEPKRD